MLAAPVAQLPLPGSWSLLPELLWQLCPQPPAQESGLHAPLPSVQWLLVGLLPPAQESGLHAPPSFVQLLLVGLL
jgi:hypothetical protein